MTDPLTAAELRDRHGIPPSTLNTWKARKLLAPVSGKARSRTNPFRYDEAAILALRDRPRRPFQNDRGNPERDAAIFFDVHLAHKRLSHRAAAAKHGVNPSTVGRALLREEVRRARSQIAS